MALPYLIPGMQADFRGQVVRVIGSLYYSEDGDTWAEHRLAGPGVDVWVTVEGDDWNVWTTRRDLAGLVPDAEALTVDGQAFHLRESGEAQYRAEGETDTPATGTLAYADYGAPSGVRLGFERFDGVGEWLTSTGQALGPDELNPLR